MTKLIISAVLLLFCVSLSAQDIKDYEASADVAVAIDVQEANPYFIKVVSSKKRNQYFPKLYPIGYIVKDTDRKKKVTNYLLGDFESENDAMAALKEVKSYGYNKAHIVRIERK